MSKNAIYWTLCLFWNRTTFADWSRNWKQKTFLEVLRVQKQEDFGISALKSNGKMFTEASGPDCIPGRILQNLARELAPVLHFIFEQSLNTGDLPAEWTLANVASIFKKGSQLQAVNYRPVSLTCISCRWQKM